MADPATRLPRLFWLLRWPIFGKELRVASRRRRTYILRSAYMGLLTVFVTLVWWSAVRDIGGDVGGIASRMGEAGKRIIATIAWFQFLATQLVAVIMLSGAISEEVNHGTLDVLMTTPINSFQIVMGKLLAGLWQVLVLLAVSLPLLAIVRVLGGVPWDYVVASLCVTFTAVTFAGSLALFCSVRARHAYAAILRTFTFAMLLYLVLPMVSGFCAFTACGMAALAELSLLANPFFVMATSTADMLLPGSWWGGGIAWGIHCIVMLAASAGVLLWTTARLRRLAILRVAGGIDTPVSGRSQARWHSGMSPSAAGPIRRVVGQPVAWREWRRPVLPKGPVARAVSVGTCFVVLLIVYGLCQRVGLFRRSSVHVVFFFGYTLLAVVTAAVLSATAVTAEKEARTWPVLLATPLSEWEILWGKARGVFRRCAPVWGLLGGHVVLFVLVGNMHPVAIPQVAILAAWVTTFLTGTGLCLSALCRRTTTAVALNFAVALTLWLVVPLLWSMSEGRLKNSSWSLNPCVQAAVIADGTGGESNAEKSVDRLGYDWPGGQAGHVVETTVLLGVIGLGCSVIAAWLACLVAEGFRRHVF